MSRKPGLRFSGFAPFVDIRCGFEELRLDFGDGAGGALMEPVGFDKLVDQVDFGFGFGLVGLETGGFQGFEFIVAFGGQDGGCGGAAVFGGVACGDGLAFFGSWAASGGGVIIFQCVFSLEWGGSGWGGFWG